MSLAFSRAWRLATKYQPSGKGGGGGKWFALCLFGLDMSTCFSAG